MGSTKPIASVHKYICKKKLGFTHTVCITHFDPIDYKSEIRNCCNKSVEPIVEVLFINCFENFLGFLKTWRSFKIVFVAVYSANFVDPGQISNKGF